MLQSPHRLAHRLPGVVHDTIPVGGVPVPPPQDYSTEEDSDYSVDLIEGEKDRATLWVETQVYESRHRTKGPRKPGDYYLETLAEGQAYERRCRNAEKGHWTTRPRKTLYDHVRGAPQLAGRESLLFSDEPEPWATLADGPPGTVLRSHDRAADRKLQRWRDEAEQEGIGEEWLREWTFTKRDGPTGHYFSDVERAEDPPPVCAECLRKHLAPYALYGSSSQDIAKIFQKERERYFAVGDFLLTEKMEKEEGQEVERERERERGKGRGRSRCRGTQRVRDVLQPGWSCPHRPPSPDPPSREPSICAAPPEPPTNAEKLRKNLQTKRKGGLRSQATSGTPPGSSRNGPQSEAGSQASVRSSLGSLARGKGNIRTASAASGSDPGGDPGNPAPPPHPAAEGAPALSRQGSRSSAATRRSGGSGAPPK